MNAYLKRWTDLAIGTVLYALGIVLTMKADIGFAPWEVFHSGLGSALGISLGSASILASMALCVVDLLLREKLGIGTVLNLLFIGGLIDLFTSLDVLPPPSGTIMSVVTMLGGLFIVAFGVYFYVRAALGIGPRDSLMVALQRKTGYPVGLCRVGIESAAVLVGWLLGGPVGPGTLLSAAGAGLCIQAVFRLMKFDATSIRNETLDMTAFRIRALLRVAREKADSARSDG